MSCAAALNVVPPRHRAACASAFAEAATAAGLPAAGTSDAAANGAPPATADAVTADNAAHEPPEPFVASSAVPPGDSLAALDDTVAAPHGSIDALLSVAPQECTVAQSDHLHGAAAQTVAAPQESGGLAIRAPKLQQGSLSDFVVQRPAANSGILGTNSNTSGIKTKPQFPHNFP